MSALKIWFTCLAELLTLVLYQGHLGLKEKPLFQLGKDQSHKSFLAGYRVLCFKSSVKYLGSNFHSPVASAWQKIKQLKDWHFEILSRPWSCSVKEAVKCIVAVINQANLKSIK